MTTSNSPRRIEYAFDTHCFSIDFPSELLSGLTSFGKTCVERDLRKCFAFSPDFPPQKSFRTW